MTLGGVGWIEESIGEPIALERLCLFLTCALGYELVLGVGVLLVRCGGGLALHGGWILRDLHCLAEEHRIRYLCCMFTIMYAGGGG